MSSLRWIILFGTLALTLVLVNGIMLAVFDDDTPAVLQYCGTSYERHPAECTISAIYDCQTHYVLRSKCAGVGDIIVDRSGEYIDWCGYTAFDAPTATDCRPYWKNPDGTTCIRINMCVTK